MPTRGKRPQKNVPKYKDSDESESGGDFEDSESEASIPKDAEDDDDSPVISEDDFEEEVQKGPVNKKTSIFRLKPTVSKMPHNSGISMATIKKNLKSVGDKLKSPEDSPPEAEIPFNIKLLTDNEKLLPSFLNLSESDTDDSETETKASYSKEPLPFKTFVLKKEPADEEPINKNDEEITVEKVTKDEACLSDSGTDSEMEDVETETQGKKGEGTPSKKLNFSHLQEQAKKLADAKQSLESYNKRYSDSKKTEEAFNIHELLAMGETEPSEKVPGSSSEAEDSGDSDVEDLEEVKGEAKSSIPKGGIQLVLDLPTDRPKAKNKQLDLEMMLKRRMNRVKKEYQVFTHKVHVLCWLGHGNFVNNTVNNQSIMAAALSLIPSEQCYPSARIDIKYVEQITKWYNGAMNLKEDKAEFKYKPNKRPLELALLQQIGKKTATSKKNLTLIFASMLRALGVKCRIVFSFRVVPLRPPDTELCSLSVKNKDPPKKGVGKDGKTSKHFVNAPASTNTDKNIKGKSSSATAKPVSKSKNASKNKSFEDISQLDGLDDRDLPKSNSRGTRQAHSKKSLALKKTDATQSTKTESASPKASGSSTMSYWDQIMQNTLEEESKVEKRINHRNLSLKSRPTVSKINIEPLSVFNESTISLGNPPFVKAPEKERDFSSALKNFLDVSPVKNPGIAKVNNNTQAATSSTGRKSSTATKTKNLDEKGSRASVRTKKTEQAATPKDVLNVPKVVRKSKSPNSDTETVSCSKRARVVKKAVLATNDTNDHLDVQNKVNSTSTKAITPKATTSKATTSKTATPVEKQIATKGKIVKKTNLPEKIKETQSVEEHVVAKLTRSRARPASSDHGSTTKSSVSDKSVVTKSLPNRGKLVTLANSVPKPPQSRIKVPPKETSSNASPSLSKQKENDNLGSQAKGNQRISRSTVPAEVSKYFSSPENATNLKKPPAGLSKSAEKRVSHRDLLNKSLPGTSSRVRSGVDVTKDIVSLVKDRIRESKAQARSKLVKDKIQNSSDDSDNMEMEDLPRGRSRKDSRNSDADFKPKSKKPPGLKTITDRRVLSSDDDHHTDGTKKRGVDVWCEVYAEEEEQWISVDVVKAQVHCSREIYTRATHPVTYIVSWDAAGHVKDVTRRYVPHWNTTTRKLRADPAWYSEGLQPWLAPRSMRETQEDKQLERMQLDAPLPVAISEYKNHPLYALKRHLLKFEVIYPPNAVTLGFVKKEAVYARDCVHVCHSREMWVKEAKVVRPAEEPYKIVKARPKWDRSTGTVIKDIPLEIFGPWQVEDYIPPQAENGMVPRNPYGNVELFKMCMLPKGTVHLQLPSLNKVARKLGIDCAPAMTGFDFHGGWSHPVYDGFVVCEEFKEQIVEAWEQEQEEAEARAREKIDKRVYGNWRRIIRGLFIRERLKARYDFASELPQNQNPEPIEPGGSKAKKRPKGPRFLAKKRRSAERSSESD